MKKEKIYPWVLLTIFSFLVSCHDRLFDNPVDPDKEMFGYEMEAIISLGSIVPRDLTFAGDAIWILAESSRMVAVNYQSGNPFRELPFTGGTCAGISSDGDYLFALINETLEIQCLNMINGEVLKTITLKNGHYKLLEYYSGSFFTHESLSNRLIEFDQSNGQIRNTIACPAFSVDGLCFDGTFLWIADASTMKIFKLSPTGQVINSYLAPDKNPAGLCHSRGIIWCGDRSGRMYKLRFQ